MSATSAIPPVPLPARLNRPRFTIGHAFGIAVVVHILLLLLVGLFPQVFASPEFLLDDEALKPPPVRFTFIDVSDENEVDANPDAELISDTDRVEAGEVPRETTPEGKLPPSEGNTREKVAAAAESSPVPPMPPARQLPRVASPPAQQEPQPESPPPAPAPEDVRPEPEPVETPAEQTADEPAARPLDEAETGPRDDALRREEARQAAASESDATNETANPRQQKFSRALDQLTPRSLPTDLQAVTPPQQTPPRAQKGGSLEWQFDNPDPAYPVNLGSISFDSKGADFGEWLKEFHIRVLAEWNRNISEWHNRVMNEIAGATMPADAAKWNAYARRINSTRGVTGINFVVTREGSVVSLEMVHASGTMELDRSVQKTLRNVLLPPLPVDYPDELLPIQAGFYYNVDPPPDRPAE